MNNASKLFAAVASVLVAWLGLTGPALAKASASAELRGLGFTLVDLNPLDGLAPALTFGPTSRSYAGAYVHDRAGSLYPGDYAFGSIPFSPVAVSAATSHGAAKARVAGGGTLDSAVATASGWVAGDGVSYNNFGAGAEPITATFTLPPWTAVRFNVEATLSASTTVGKVGLDSEYANAFAALQLLVVLEGGYEPHDSYLDVSVAHTSTLDPVTGNYFYGGESRNETGAFSLSYGNSSALSAEGFFYAGVSTQAGSPFAVPEPGTCALMLAGLSLVGVALQRRRSN